MRRGDIYLADLEPVQGSEANKVRPAVIVSRDALYRVVDERGQGVVTVVPLTRNTERVLSFQVFLPADETGLNQDSKAQAEQVRAVSVNRLRRRLGSVPPAWMAALDHALRLHLAL